MLDEQAAVRFDDRNAVSHNLFDGLQAPGPRGKRNVGFGGKRLEKGIALPHVRRIRNDDPETTAFHGPGPVAVHEFDIRDIQVTRILRGDGQRICADVYRRDVAQRPFSRHGKGDCAAAGPEVEHLPAGFAWNDAQRKVDEQLGFGPRHQRRGADHEFERPELLDSTDISHRLACKAPLQRFLEALDRGLVEDVLGVCKQISARHIDRACNQQLGIQACRVADVAQALSGIRNRVCDGNR